MFVVYSAVAVLLVLFVVLSLVSILCQPEIT